MEEGIRIEGNANKGVVGVPVCADQITCRKVEAADSIEGLKTAVVGQ